MSLQKYVAGAVVGGAVTAAALLLRTTDQDSIPAQRCSGNAPCSVPIKMKLDENKNCVFTVEPLTGVADTVNQISWTIAPLSVGDVDFEFNYDAVAQDPSRPPVFVKYPEGVVWTAATSDPKTYTVTRGSKDKWSAVIYGVRAKFKEKKDSSFKPCSKDFDPIIINM